MAGRNWEDIFKTPPKHLAEASAEAGVDVGSLPVPYGEVGADGVIAARLTLINRQGAHWSYPYGYTGLVEMPTPEILIIHGNCGTVETIQIHGRGLAPLLSLFSLQRLTEVRESEHPDYDSSSTVIKSITINLA